MISHDNGGAPRGASETTVTAEASDQPSSNNVFPILVRSGTEEEEKEKLPSVSTDEGVNDETSDPVGDADGVYRFGITRSNHLSGRSPSRGMYDPKSCCRGYGDCDS